MFSFVFGISLCAGGVVNTIYAGSEWSDNPSGADLEWLIAMSVAAVSYK